MDNRIRALLGFAAGMLAGTALWMDVDSHLTLIGLAVAVAMAYQAGTIK